jgi:hypothetical protein
MVVVFVVISRGLSKDGVDEDVGEKSVGDVVGVDSVCLFLVDDRDDGVEEMPEPEPEDSKPLLTVVGKAKMVEVTVP